MALTIGRIAVVSSNVTNICSLLNVADEQNFLQNCMSPEQFQECMACDSNMKKVETLCVKVIHELSTGSKIMYDALCGYFMKRSEAYKLMYQSFTDITPNNTAQAELLLLQEKVESLTLELLNLRQSPSLTVCQSESIVIEEIYTVSETNTAAVNADLVQADAMDKIEAYSGQPLLMGSTISLCLNNDIKSVPKDETEVGDEPDVEVLMENVEDEAGQCTPNRNSHNDDELNGPAGETQHLCEHCGKSFNSSGKLVKHARTHRKKPFDCEHCGQCCRDRCDLVRHIRTHTGEKPYACEHCEKRFAMNCSLLAHLRVHTGEKLFRCEHCGESFTKKMYLVRHIGIHTGEKHDRMSLRPKSALVKHVPTKRTTSTVR